MPTEKNDIPDKKRGNSDEARQQRNPSVSHTEVGSAEFVISGPNANINVNKASFQDFIAVYEYAKQGDNRAPDDIVSPQKKSQGDHRATSQSTRTSAFISYSHADSKYLEELHAHLSPLG
jgi:hypothetical protein